MSEQKIESKYIDKDPPMGTEQQLEKKNNDYLAYLKEKLNFILGTYGRRLTDADGHVNELIRTAAEFAVILSHKVGDDEIISMINQSPEQITISGNRINLVGQVTFSDLDSSTQSTINSKTTSSQVTQIIGNTVNAAYINALEINAKKIVATYSITWNHSNYSNADLTTMQNLITSGAWTEADLAKYDINLDGQITVSDVVKVRNMILNGTDETASITTEINPAKPNRPIAIFNGSNLQSYISPNSVCAKNGTFERVSVSGGTTITNGGFISIENTGGHMMAGPDWIRVSDENNNINEMVAAGDSVIEKGTSGSWTYRKWYSGVYECWTTIAPVEKSFSAWGTGYYSTEMGGLAYPVTFKTRPTEIPSVIAGNAWYSLMSSDTANTTTTSGKYRALRPVSGNAYVGLALYVKGELP